MKQYRIVEKAEDYYEVLMFDDRYGGFWAEKGNFTTKQAALNCLDRLQMLASSGKVVVERRF